MERKNRIFVLLAVLFGCICLSSVVAQTQIMVSPSLIFATVTDDDYSFSTTITNKGTDALEVSVYAAGMHHNQIGGVEIEEAEDALEGAAQIFALEPKEFILPPGKSQTVQITVNIAQAKSMGPSGGAYAEILFGTSPFKGEGGQITNIARIGVPTLVTLPGPKELTGNITQVSVEQAKPGDKIRILTRFKNTGNVHFIPKGGTVIITDQSGDEVRRVPIESHMAMPGLERYQSAACSPEGLPVGVYSVESAVEVEDGVRTNPVSAFFSVISPGTIAQPSGNIVDFPPLRAAHDEPVQFKLLFSNTGNVKLTPQGEVEIKDDEGDLLATLSTTTKPIAPASSAELSATLEKGLPEGTYMAIAEVTYSRQEYGEIKTARVQVEFEVMGEPVIIDGEIVEFSVPSVESGQPIVPTLLLKNTGNTDFGVEGLIEIKNSAGKSVGQVPIPKTLVGVGETKALGQPWQGTLPVGLYKAAATLILGGEKILTGEAPFVVK